MQGAQVQFERLKQQLDRGGNIKLPKDFPTNYRDTTTGMTLLEYALVNYGPASKVSEQAINTLVEISNVADITDLEASQTTAMNGAPIHYAAEKGLNDALQMMMDKMADNNMDVAEGLKITNQQGRTPLHLAVNSGHTRTIDKLIDNGASVYALDDDLATPLHLGASNGNLAVVQQLINAGSDVNTQDGNDQTPFDLVPLDQQQDFQILRPAEPQLAPAHTPVQSQQDLQRQKLQMMEDLFDALDRDAPDDEVLPMVDALDQMLAPSAEIAQQPGRIWPPQPSSTWQPGQGTWRTQQSQQTLYQVQTPLQQHASSQQIALVPQPIQQSTTSPTTWKAGVSPTVRKQSEQREQEQIKTQAIDALFDAFARGAKDYEVLPLVDKVIDTGADINARDGQQNTFLHIAVQQGRTGIALHLVERGKADVHLQNKAGQIPQDLISSKDLEAALRLTSILERTKPSTTKPQSAKSTQILAQGAPTLLELLKDLQTKDHVLFALLETLLDRPNADLSILKITDELGNTPLHLAVKQGRNGIAKYMVQKGKADLNLVNGDGKAPRDLVPLPSDHKLRQEKYSFLELRPSLHQAIHENNGIAIKEFIDRGDNVNAINMGATPLHLAAQSRNLTAFKQLIAAGANANIPDKHGKVALDLVPAEQRRSFYLVLNPLPPLHQAVSDGNAKAIAELIAKGSDVDAVHEGLTPLHLAAQSENLAVFQQLIAAGANANIPTNDGKIATDLVPVEQWLEFYQASNPPPPLHQAVSAGKTKAIAGLIAKGENVNAVHGGITALHIAAQSGNLAAFQQLIAAGADANILDNDGRMATDLVQGDQWIDFALAVTTPTQPQMQPITLDTMPPTETVQSYLSTPTKVGPRQPSAPTPAKPPTETSKTIKQINTLSAQLTLSKSKEERKGIQTQLEAAEKKLSDRIKTLETEEKQQSHVLQQEHGYTQTAQNAAYKQTAAKDELEEAQTAKRGFKEAKKLEKQEEKPIKQPTKAEAPEKNSATPKQQPPKTTSDLEQKKSTASKKEKGFGSAIQTALGKFTSLIKPKHKGMSFGEQIKEEKSGQNKGLGGGRGGDGNNH